MCWAMLLYSTLSVSRYFAINLERIDAEFVGLK